MKRFGVVFAISLVAALLPASDALAARAAVDLSIKAADTSVASNSDIVITGKASSSRAKCKRNKLVYLYVDGSQVGSDTTNLDGKYRFEFPGPHPAGEHKFMTKILRSRRCKESAPNTVTVTVN
jgi:hypothetical protein